MGGTEEHTFTSSGVTPQRGQTADFPGEPESDARTNDVSHPQVVATGSQMPSEPTAVCSFTEHLSTAKREDRPPAPGPLEGKEVGCSLQGGKVPL